MQLRTYVLIDSMQPQYAAYTGKRAFGMIPVEGDAQIYMEISPAAEVYKVMDIALKTTDVKPGFLSMEREYGFLEIHSSHQEAVKYTGGKALESMGSERNRQAKTQSAFCEPDFRYRSISGSIDQCWEPRRAGISP